MKQPATDSDERRSAEQSTEELQEPALFRGSVALCAVFLLLGLVRLWWSAPQPAAATPAIRPQFKLDLNQATEAELETLPDVGGQLAKRIVRDREQQGHYRSVDELNRVRGVGQVTIDQIRGWLEVGDEPAERAIVDTATSDSVANSSLSQLEVSY